MLPAASGGKGTISKSISTLPAGLQADLETGIITGIPTTVGTTNVTYTVSDSSDPAQEVSTTFTIEVVNMDISFRYRI